MAFVVFAAFWREQGFLFMFFNTLVAHARLFIVCLQYFCASRVYLVFGLLIVLSFYETFVNDARVLQTCLS